MSTRSPICCGKPASSTIIAPRLESPLPDAESSRVRGPTLPPISVATTTNAIQPRIAVLRCVALHLPARAGRFFGCTFASPVRRLGTVEYGPSRGAPLQGGLPASRADQTGGRASAAPQSLGAGRTPAVRALRRHGGGNRPGDRDLAPRPPAARVARRRSNTQRSTTRSSRRGTRAIGRPFGRVAPLAGGLARP